MEMKWFLISANIVWLVAFSGNVFSPRGVLEGLEGVSVFIISLNSAYIALTGKPGRTWLSLFLERKRLEEHNKINSLKKPS